jgi:hypothetical protein
MLKINFKQYGVRIWTGFNWLRRGIVAGPYEHNNEQRVLSFGI